MSWRKVRLSEIVENFSVKAKNDNGAEGLEFFGVSNEEGITVSKYAAEDKAEEYKIIEKGCFAYNPYRINVGSIAYLNEDKKGLISPAYVVFKVKPNTIKEELLLKFLKSSEGLRQIRMYGRGTVRQALRFEDLCKIELSIPTFEQQKVLWDKLEKVDEKGLLILNELTNQFDLIKQLRQAFLREAFLGKLTEKWRKENPNIESAKELLKRIKAEKEQLVKEGKIKKEKPLPPIKEDEIPFEIPDSWVWCRLGEMSNSRLGKMLDGVKNKGNELPYLRNLNVQWHNFNLDDVLLMKFEQSEIEEYSVKKGDLLICEGGEPGRAAIWELENEGIKFQKALHRVRFLCNVNPYFYLYLIEFYCKSRLIEDFFTGSGIQHLTGKSLKYMPVPIVPKGEQVQIVQILKGILNNCNMLETNIIHNTEQTEQLMQVALKEVLEPKAYNY